MFVRARSFVSLWIVLVLAFALALLAAGAIAAATPAESKPAAAAKRAAATRHVLPFIDDDLARARAEAKKTNRPIFVESWAPW